LPCLENNDQPNRKVVVQKTKFARKRTSRPSSELADDAVTIGARATDQKVADFESSRENKYAPREDLRKTLFADPLAAIRRSRRREKPEPLSTIDINVYEGLEERPLEADGEAWKQESLDDLSARVDPSLVKSMCDDLGVDPCLIAGYEPPVEAAASEVTCLSDVSDLEEEGEPAAYVRLVVGGPRPQRVREVTEPLKKQPLTKEQEEEQERKMAKRGEAALRRERSKLAMQRDAKLLIGRNKQGIKCKCSRCPCCSVHHIVPFTAESIGAFSKRVRQVNVPPPKPMLSSFTSKPENDGTYIVH
jgi:hypothetical protein